MEGGREKCVIKTSDGCELWDKTHVEGTEKEALLYIYTPIMFDITMPRAHSQITDGDAVVYNAPDLVFSFCIRFTELLLPWTLNVSML